MLLKRRGKGKRQTKRKRWEEGKVPVVRVAEVAQSVGSEKVGFA